MLINNLINPLNKLMVLLFLIGTNKSLMPAVTIMLLKMRIEKKGCNSSQNVTKYPVQGTRLMMKKML